MKAWVIVPVVVVAFMAGALFEYVVVPMGDGAYQEGWSDGFAAANGSAYQDGYHEGWHDGAGWKGRIFDPWTAGGALLVMLPVVGVCVVVGLVLLAFRLRRVADADASEQEEG